MCVCGLACSVAMNGTTTAPQHCAYRESEMKFEFKWRLNDVRLAQRETCAIYHCENDKKKRAKNKRQTLASTLDPLKIDAKNFRDANAFDIGTEFVRCRYSANAEFSLASVNGEFKRRPSIIRWSSKWYIVSAIRSRRRHIMRWKSFVASHDPI